MTPPQFIAKWKQTSLTERSACQQHFLDLCELLGQPKPAAADPDGAWYTFERGVSKTGGGSGWADVWKRGHFGWEYKGKHKDLAAAYRQLLLYREDLDNPPLLVVCDMDRFEIRTNFTGTAKQVHRFDLDGLADPHHLDVLRKLFTQPDALKPGQTTEGLTRQAAELFGQIADGMRVRGLPALDAAHFLMKLMFCMFAEDIELLPNRVFTKILTGARKDPARLDRFLKDLFTAMSTGGDFGADEIAWFNGGLFADAHVIELTPKEIDTLNVVNAFDWSEVEPSIFGTLFERTLDPAKRSQIGAHYTSRADIETLLEPVMMAPLRREWAEVKTACEALLPKIRAEAKKRAGAKTQRSQPKESKPRRDFDKLIRDFLERLAHVSVLDPACGSGNFLYVALHLLLDLEKEVIAYAATQGLGLFPQVRPTQLAGIEINPYAQQLAQVVIWIGYLQWMRDNGFNPPRNPVLEPIESIQRMDAILDLSDPEHPLEPEWPPAEFIVGNPPFLGGKRILSELGETYTERMRQLWDSRLPHFSDLCCYWFEKARSQIERGQSKRAGLLATQGIRGGANREALSRIKETGNIFYAESDRDWILNGATVHVSMIGFDGGEELIRTLDGMSVSAIHPNLTAGVDLTTARPLARNEDRSFIGIQKSGPFDIGFDRAMEYLQTPSPSGRPNSDVLRVYWTAIDVVRRPLDMWIIDFGLRSEAEASLYELPFEYLKERVPTERSAKHFAKYPFWQLWRPRGEMWDALAGLTRFVVTPHVSKHRIFAWADPCVCPSNLLIASASDAPFDFGVLQSRVHEAWARGMGTQLREKESGFRYTTSTCFETFPFPEPTDAQREAIAAAARELDALRTNWLNPPEWTREQILEFPGSTDGPWSRYIDRGDKLPACPPAAGDPATGRTSSPPGLQAGSHDPKSRASAPSATRGSSPGTKTPPATSRNARSRTSTTSPPPGSPSPTANSTKPSSQPTAGRRISRTSSSWSGCWG